MVSWVAGISLLHFFLNVDWASAWNDNGLDGKRKVSVAYIPVT